MNMEDSKDKRSKGNAFTKMKTQSNHTSVNRDLSKRKNKDKSLNRLKTLGMLWSVGQKSFKSKNFTQPSPEGKSIATPKRYQQSNELFHANNVMKLRENFHNLEERKKVKIGAKRKI